MSSSKKDINKNNFGLYFTDVNDSVGVENCLFPLTKLVAVNTGLALLAARDSVLVYTQIS